MQTRYFTIEEKDIREAAELIKAGQLVGFPTETVYGLGGNALDAQASRKIYAAKGRPSDNPLIVHISELDEIYDLVTELSPNAGKLAEAIWPGPATIVLPKKEIVPDATTGGLKTVAIRLPLTEEARKLIKYSGVPIAAPSANLSGRPSPTRWEHVRNDMDGKVAGIIMGQPSFAGIESTVIDMTGELPEILRPGLITPERITEVLGLPCSYDPAVTGKPQPGMVPKAPGMKYKHYAPRAEMILYSGKREDVLKAMDEKNWKLCGRGLTVTNLFYENGKEAAERLFDDLRKADERGADCILCNALPEDNSVNYSVMNRMLKAAGYRIEEV